MKIKSTAFLIISMFIFEIANSQEINFKDITYSGPFNAQINLSLNGKFNPKRGYRFAISERIGTSLEYQIFKYDYVNGATYTGESIPYNNGYANYYARWYKINPNAVKVTFGCKLAKSEGAVFHGFLEKNAKFYYDRNINTFRRSFIFQKNTHQKKDLNYVKIDDLDLWKFYYEIQLTDELTEMPLKNVEVQITTKKFWNPSIDSKKFFVNELDSYEYCEFGNDYMKKGYIYKFKTNEEGTLKLRISPTFEGEYAFDLYIRAEGRRPVRKSFTGTLSRDDLLNRYPKTKSLKIIWPTLPLNIAVTDEMGQPKFIEK